MTRAHYFVLTLALAFCTGISSAQVPTGTPPFGSFSGGPDIIDLANLNSHIAIPVLHKSGRGTNFTYDLSYDSSVWYPVGSSGNQNWQPVTNWSWRAITEITTGYVSYSTGQIKCYDSPPGFYWVTTYSRFRYHDPFGAVHSFATPTLAACSGFSQGATVTANDGSGYTITADDAGGASITSSSGEIINPPVQTGTGPATATDRNGNQITVSGSTFTDTLGTTALTVTGGAPNPLNFAYAAPSGSAVSFTISYVTRTIKTNFGCSGIAEYGPTSNSLVDRITLPDGSFYQFNYEPTLGFSGDYTGRLASVTLPTGGGITYSYTGGSNGISCADGSAATVTRTTPDGAWTYAQVKGSGAASTTTVTDPQGNVTQIQFQGIYETQRIVNQGSSTTLVTTNTCYNGATSPCNGTAITLPITQRSVTNQLGASGPTNKTVFTYNTFGLMTEEDDYDFPSGTSLLKRTLITFANLGNNLNAFRQTVTVQDGSGNVKFRQDTNYDEATPTCVTGAPQHDDSGHGCSFNSRANATSVTMYTNPSAPSGGITQTLTYDTLGNLRTAKDALNNTTTLAYSPDAWGNAACPPSATTYAYPVSASNALSQTTNFTYFACTGQPASVKDPNNQTTSITYDSLLRPTQTNFPDGGQTTITYNSQTSISTSTKMNSSQNIIGTLLLDGLGRTLHTQLNSDPQGVDYVDTTYDSLGRVASVSNPYRSTSDPTYGITSYVYDALSRICVVIPPDGNSVSGGTCPASQPSNDIFAIYSGVTTTVTDQVGKQRSSSIDGLGRLSQITEDPGGLGYITTYLYDALSNLTSVTQNGGRQRTYVYDALSRLTTETNPESGTTNYYFTTSGGALCSGSASQVCRRTDARNITTTYAFDVLNRLTAKTYSDGTPALYFSYDVAPSWMSDLTNVVGRLVEADNQFGGTTGGSAAAAVNSYDAMGRVVRQWQQTPSTSPGGYFIYHSYDLAGNLISATNPAGVAISYAYDNAGRHTTVTSSWSDAQHPATLASGVSYMPASAFTAMTLGNGLLESRAYNNRLQPTEIKSYTSSNFVRYDFTYGYNDSSNHNNGNVMSWNSAGWEFNFNRTYSYDSLNRLATLSDSNSGQSCKGLSWTYDAWGNRTDQNVTAGTCNTFHNSVNTNNQLVGPPYQYDAAGNMINDASHSYSYDAENHLIQVDAGATGSYVYDADGRRIRKNSGGSWTEYYYNASGPVTAEYNPSGWQVGYVYLNGQVLAQYFNSTTYFGQGDHLGSARLFTAVDGSVAQSWDYLPYGELLQGTFLTTHQFTGDERDSETGLDHTQFRQYSSSLGRWMHPDPAGLAAVDPSNPQSWNRYAYVLNNPMNSVDPSGRRECLAVGVGGCDVTSASSGGGGGYTDSGYCPPQFSYCGGGDAGGGLGIGIGIGIGFGGGGGDKGGTNPPIPPPNNPGTTFPGNPAGQIICVNIPGQPPVCVSTSNPNWFWTLFKAFWEHVPWAGAVFIPIEAAGNMVSVEIPVAYLPSSKIGCLGIGLAATTPTGKFVAGGPLTMGNLDNAQNILSSWGFSFGGQATPFVGVQAISNSSGSLGGPTLATETGLSGGFTWSKCGPIK